MKITITLSDDVAPSRWAQVVERIKRQDDPLADYAEKLARDQREFRQGFHFRHDEPYTR